MSNLIDHIIEGVDCAGNTLPADFESVDELAGRVDQEGEAVLLDILNWQPNWERSS